MILFLDSLGEDKNTFYKIFLHDKKSMHHHLSVNTNQDDTYTVCEGSYGVMTKWPQQTAIKLVIIPFIGLDHKLFLWSKTKPQSLPVVKYITVFLRAQIEILTSKKSSVVTINSFLKSILKSHLIKKACLLCFEAAYYT